MRKMFLLDNLDLFVVHQIFSDNVCPWCFVGKRNLESAIKQFTAKEASSSFDVRWKPFFLNVESPETSEVAIVVSARLQVQQCTKVERKSRNHR